VKLPRLAGSAFHSRFLLRSAAADSRSAPACKEAEITVQTYYRWRQEYGGLKLDQVKRLKELVKENSKLKRLVVELSLEKQVLKDVAFSKNSVFKTAPLMHVFIEPAHKELGNARTTLLGADLSGSRPETRAAL
jgi:putative transposase